jgi:hypothetical protein
LLPVPLLKELEHADLWGPDALALREKELAIERGDEKPWWQKQLELERQQREEKERQQARDGDRYLGR